MLTNLSSTKQTKVYKNRVINFETSRKSHDNFIFVASEDKQDMIDVLNSNLFKKQQLISVYMNRVIKPLGRKAEYIDLKDYYKDIKKDTKNRIKLGFLNPQMYQGRNIIYDGSILMTSTLARLEASRGGTRSNLRFARDFYPTLYSEKSDEIMYTNNILLFPLTKHIPAFRKKISMVNPSESNPLILFLKDLKEGKFQNYSNYDHAVIYSPSNKRMYVVDLSKKPDTSAIRRSFRLISFMNSLLGDGIDIDVEDIELDVELEFEDDGKDESEDNVKDQIKEIIINRFSDKLKAKLDDSDPISKEEENISVKLDQKIDSYLSKSENLAKPFNDLVAEIEADREIISNTLKYVESKKASMKKLNQLSQNLDKELESIISLQDIEEEINSTTIEGETLSLTDKYILPDPVKTPKVSNFDREYNRKQLKKDIGLVLSGFSSAEFSPMSIQSIEVTDTSTDFNQVETYRVVYKTDDGARLTFSVDIPKIIDDRYFYLGGNKKSITKQMTKLPLIKSKADRVELTTNYSKITFERTSGKISRKNAYLLKVLERYKNNPNINIIYGDNSVVNDAYISDFEYEELATSLTSIKTRDFKVIFNRENMRDELSVYPVPIEFIEDERYTPFALTVEKDDENRKVIYINKDDGQVYQMELYSKNDKHKFETISADMFNFLTKDVLGMSDAELLKLPTIGKSFVFSQMKMFGAKYPVISVVGLTRGLEYVLKRHKVKYSLSDTRRKTAGDEVEVKFADKWLYYDGEIRNTMLLNALYLMETEKYKFTDFNTDEPYLNFFVNRMGQPMYIKDTMKINFDVIIDPITKEVLRDMKEPTDIVDVILKASDMLINNTYTRQNNMHNYRIRGNELVPAILYDVMAEAYVEYKRAKLNGQNINKLNIPKEKVIAKLIKLPNVNDHSTLNPILEIENVGLASPKGHIGVNMTRAYNLETRAYDASMMGVLSGNSTPVGANSGIARSLAYNNTITHVRGYIPATPDPNTLDGTEILGTTELLSPFTSVSADPTR